MSINGIPAPYGNPGLLPGLGRGRVEDETRPVAPATTPPAESQPSLGNPQGQALPAEAPPGTDPALWRVLSASERSFFAQVRSMGPLTYGPRAASVGDATSALQGGRIDVRV